MIDRIRTPYSGRKQEETQSSVVLQYRTDVIITVTYNFIDAHVIVL